MMITKPTKKQSQSVPVRRLQVKCTGAVVNGRCQCCGVPMTRNVPHNPGWEGQFGYVLFFRDGSSYQTAPFKRS